MHGFENFNFDRDLIVGVGSALVDILVHESDDFLQKHGAAKGGMLLVDKPFIEDLLNKLSVQPALVPGGSACNTAVGVGKLGGRSRFVGTCGNGRLGRLFKTDLEKQNVEPALFTSDSPTGRVLSIITPDAQRSMFTYLGAASETRPAELSNGCFDHAAIVHIEGYLLFNPDLILAAAKSAKASGALISLDLASYTVVAESKTLVEQIVDDYVDILIANEDEAAAFTGFTNEEQALARLAEKAPVAALKLGHRGSYIACNQTVVHAKGLGSGEAVDTTGAGDFWAAGFLFGLVNGYSIEKSAKIGSVCGYEVCQVIGASIPDEGWQRIKAYLNTV
jgi:sugar/nucleoside kinase (ribokinase family)